MTLERKKELLTKPHWTYHDISEYLGCGSTKAIAIKNQALREFGGSMEVSEYENEEEFLSGMYWNRDVAKEYGDKVPTLKQIKNDLAHPNADQYFNGAWFLKLTGITPDEYFDRGFVYAR